MLKKKKWKERIISEKFKWNRLAELWWEEIWEILK
jgi:hypothetical protein